MTTAMQDVLPEFFQAFVFDNIKSLTEPAKEHAANLYRAFLHLAGQSQLAEEIAEHFFDDVRDGRVKIAFGADKLGPKTSLDMSDLHGGAPYVATRTFDGEKGNAAGKIICLRASARETPAAVAERLFVMYARNFLTQKSHELHQRFMTEYPPDREHWAPLAEKRAAAKAAKVAAPRQG